MYITVKIAVTMTYGVSRTNCEVTCSRKRHFGDGHLQRVGACGMHQAEEADQQDRPHDQQAQILGARRAQLRSCSTRQRKLKLSSTFWIVLSNVQIGRAKPTDPTHAAADVIREFHDPRGDLGRARLTHRAEELENDRLEVTMCAEALEHGEREGDERHHREERRIHEPHCTQVDVPVREVARATAYG